MLCLSILSVDYIFSQSEFSRNDVYDFSVKHYIRAGGTDLNNFNIFIDDSTEFTTFKLHVIKSRLNINDQYFANKYRVDMNNDGSWEQDWTTSDEKTIIYTYPLPANGINENKTVKIEIEFSDILGNTTKRTKYKDITIYTTPRVFVNSDNDVFVQLRDEGCSEKIPVLFVEGFDPLNENFPARYYELTYDLVNSDLYPNGYEVFILNFNDGGRDMRLNADVILKSLEKIHQLCPNYKIALAGLSMGGVISRYALAKVEDQNSSHEVGIFLSYDSPQDKAHVSPELQDWIKNQDPNEGAIGLLQDNLRSLAAKQLLRYNTYDPEHIESDNFFGELNNLNNDGYPHVCYNASISNGNMSSTWGYGSVGRDLMTLKINEQVFKTVAAVQLDCGTGSMTTQITKPRYGDIFSNPFFRIYYELNINFNPVFIPTWSGLDLVDPDIDDISGYILSYDHSKFDDFLVQESPLKHHELSIESRNQIMTWLDLDFNIGINYDLMNGGEISSDNYQVNILHGKSVQIQTQATNVNGRNITYNFLEWEDGDQQNPRTFFASHNIQHYAKMKGHLVSNNAWVTGENNGRRLYKTDEGVIYLVYDDDGDIYFTHSSDNGETWSKETRISDGFDSRYPSIAGTKDILFVTWLDQANCNIKFRRFNYSTNSWYSTKTVGYLGEYNTIKPHPSIAVSEIPTDKYNTCIAFQQEKHNGFGQPNGQSEVVVWGNTDYSYEGWDRILGPLDGNNPSLSYSNAGGGNVGIVWDNSGQILFRTCPNQGEWSSTKQINDDLWYRSSEHKPNISYTFGIAHIVWEGEEEPVELPNGYYRYYDVAASTLSDITKIEPKKEDGEVGHLSISTVQAFNSQDAYDYTIFYSSDEITKLSKTGNSVTSDTYGEGGSPNITEHDMSRAVWEKYSNSPYFIKNDYTEPGNGQPIGPIVNPTYPVVDYIVDASQNNNVEGCITLEIENVKFNGDTVFLKNDLMSDSISITQNYIPMEVEFKVRFHDVYNGFDPEEIMFSFVLNEGSTEDLLTQVKYKELPTPNGNDFERTLKVTTVVNLSGKDGRIQFKGGSPDYILTKAIKEGVNAGSSQKGFAPHLILPVAFALHQNFPNPFNPSTHITVELPQAGNVYLAVYNVKGQKVKDLLSGWQNAGIYEVVFDGRDLASGVYFYRLQAGNVVQTKRMLLVK